MRKLALSTIAVAILYLPLSARVLNVPLTYGSIKAAITAATQGDTVLVAPGLYTENLSFRGKSITVTSNFILDSNFATVGATIIDGSGSINDDSGSVVLFQNQENSQAALIGFTIRGGFGTLIGNSYLGGGILCRNGSGPTISYNVIRGNVALDGGGCAFLDSDPVFMCNQIVSNNATSGGGLRADRSNASIARNIFIANTASQNGGAVCLVSSSGITFVNNIFSANTAPAGAAMFCSGSSPTVTYSDFFNNTPASSVCVNCPAGWGDTTCCTNYNKIPCDQYKNIFRRPDFVGGGDYGLLCSSPLIDAGFPSNAQFPADGKYKDIGLCEFHYLVGDVYLDGRTNFSDIILLIEYVFRAGTAPCPLYRGDFNCDRKINLIDIGQMINYIFYKGPGPCQGQ